jgi:hypothetical protein
MRRSSGINVSSSIRAGNDGRSRSPSSHTPGDVKTPSGRGMSQRERFLSPGGGREGTQVPMHVCMRPYDAPGFCVCAASVLRLCIPTPIAPRGAPAQCVGWFRGVSGWLCGRRGGTILLPRPSRRHAGGAPLLHLMRTVPPHAQLTWQDAEILQSAWSDDVKIRQGKALLKPSEIRNRTPGKKRIKDWGECPLTFDAIKEPVRAGDGNVYERWAIKKWLEENGNRSPLTNVIISAVLTPLQDADEGTVKGSRYISPDRSKESIKTEINTVLNTVRDDPGMAVDESQYVDVPSGAQKSAAKASDAALGRGEEPDDTAPAAAGGELDPADRNKMIAALMRDTSLSAAERNAKIQALRSGNNFAPEPDTLKPPRQPPPPAATADSATAAPRQSSVGASRVETDSRPAASAGSSMRDAGSAAGVGTGSQQQPQSDARGAATGAVKRAQAGLMASGSSAETRQMLAQRDREEARARDAEDRRLSQLKSRGFSGFDPAQLAAGPDDLLELEVKTQQAPAPRVNIDWGTVPAAGKADPPGPPLPPTLFAAQADGTEAEREREGAASGGSTAYAVPPPSGLPYRTIRAWQSARQFIYRLISLLLSLSRSPPPPFYPACRNSHGARGTLHPPLSRDPPPERYRELATKSRACVTRPCHAGPGFRLVKTRVLRR